MHVVGVVETTSVSVVMAIQVASSAVKRARFMKNVLRTSRMVEIQAIEPNLYHLLPQERVAPK